MTRAVLLNSSLPSFPQMLSMVASDKSLLKSVQSTFTSILPSSRSGVGIFLRPINASLVSGFLLLCHSWKIGFSSEMHTLENPLTTHCEAQIRPQHVTHPSGAPLSPSQGSALVAITQLPAYVSAFSLRLPGQAEVCSIG